MARTRQPQLLRDDGVAAALKLGGHLPRVQPEHRFSATMASRPH